ncbi:VOC family protein [Nonomuraea roseoviolacea subsp. roseoviolacea]|uniref:VOC family protein n=1 Tax=Nonomuraea roseoviolacea TaxID=103837 RepID=UPI0031D7BD65
MGIDITGLHHVGHIVHDMGQAMDCYRRLGFTVAAPAYPLLPRVAGGVAEPFGVANAHVQFPRNFIELVAVIDDPGRMPGEARPTPLQVPDDRLPGLLAAIGATTANIASFLQRFQGLHIMIADTPDIDGIAARLTAADIDHAGVHAVRRPVETHTGTTMEPVRYLEISAPGLPAGRVPEGRIGFAESAPAPLRGNQSHTVHPNGATGLVECVLCVADEALPALTQRYATYFGQARDGRPHSFDRANVTVLTASTLGDLLPGERPAALPAFVACTVSVRDIAATRQFLHDNDVHVSPTGREEIFVPAKAALGTAIIFRQEE